MSKFNEATKQLYDGRNRVIRYVYDKYGDFTEQFFSFDQGGRLLSISYTDKVPDSSGNFKSSILRESYELKYDQAGNISTDTSYTNYSAPITVTREYEYDNSNRLTREVVNGKAFAEYTFDVNGNRKSLTTNTCTLYYDYNELNELTRIPNDPNFTSLVAVFTYDLNNQ